MAFFDKLFKKQSGETQQPGWETQTYTGLDGNMIAPGDDGAPDVLVEPGVPMDVLGNEIPVAEAIYDYPGEYAQRFDGVDPGTSEASGGWYVSKPQVTLQSSDGDAAPGDDSSKWLLTGQMPTGGSMGEAPDADVEAKFEISQPDQQIGSFAELQGINTELDVVDYVESEQDETLKQMPLDQPDSGFSGPYVVTGVEHTATESSEADAPPGAWEHQYELRSGKFAQTDHNFETPLDGEPDAASSPDVEPPLGQGDDTQEAGVYGYGGATGEYGLIPAAAEEPVNPPGALEYPNLTFHVPEADQAAPATPGGPQGFGFVTFEDAAESPAPADGVPPEDTGPALLPQDSPVVGTLIGDAIGNPAGDGSEEDAELEDEAILLKLSDSPQMTPIHESDGWEVALPEDGDADDDEADDDP